MAKRIEKVKRAPLPLAFAKLLDLEGEERGKAEGIFVGRLQEVAPELVLEFARLMARDAELDGAAPLSGAAREHAEAVGAFVGKLVELA